MKRRRGGIDSNAFDVLVEHDVRAYLLVQALRGKQRTDGRYGYTTWWLTLDHTGFRVQQAAKAKHITFATPVGSCMSPDFLLRYLSIRPRTQGEEDYLDSVLPLSVELAGAGLVPAELREAARIAMESVKDEPQYVQRRKLRDVLNKARTEPGELLESGIDDTVRAIEESLGKGEDE